MNALFLLVSLLLISHLDAHKLYRHFGSKISDYVQKKADLPTDEIAETFYSNLSRNRRAVSRYLCGFEVLEPAIRLCNGCLFEGTESEVKRILSKVSVKCCGGKCSESVLMTLCGRRCRV